MEDKLHSIESAAEFLGGLSPWTIRRWLSQGRLQRIKVGSRTMVRESELLRFVETCTSVEKRPEKDV
ncbi:MAG TPA: helix-turn-helix domain-containing protein [Terriglobales bacterium]|nr:helix-turn-helix domain-containing protein [Terriglobales bacterium]